MCSDPKTPIRSLCRLSRLLAGTTLVFALLSTQWANAQIQWRSGTSAPARKTVQQLQADLEALAKPANRRHIIVEFTEPVTPESRRLLAASGVTLMNYLGNHAFFATFSAGGVDVARLAREGNLRNAMTVAPEWKIDPLIQGGEVPDWAIASKSDDGSMNVVLYVLFHPDVDLFTDGVIAVFAHAGSVLSDIEAINGLVIQLPYSNIEPLAAEDVVQWIEWPLPAMSHTNDSNRAITEADVVQDAPYNLDGSGVHVLVYDGGTIRATHVDFQGRVTVRDGSGMSYHATHVGGTIGGAGVADSTYKGMAPGVTMESYGFEVPGGLEEGFLYTDPGDIEDDYSEAISLHGVHISNNSIGSNTAPNGFPCEWEGNYGVTGNLIDTIVRGDGSNPLFNEPFRIVWANGNERGSGRCGTEYHTTAPPACAKNHITVGALNSNDDSMTSFSSWGPTDDDRLKPDISAPGCQNGGDDGVTSTDDASDTAYYTLCGTSMAAPTVTGLAALLLQDYHNQYPGFADPRNSTLKGWFAHSAVDLGNTGPDYQFGYGSVRVQQAIDLMRTGKFIEDSIDQGGTISRQYEVAPGTPELKVTLAWDDFPGTPNVMPVLVNDLDLRVYSPTSVRHYPWTLGGLADPSSPAVRTDEDHVNNIEQVLVDNPEAGTWTIEVHGYDVPQGPQPYSLVGDGAANFGLAISFPNGLPDLVSPGTPISFDVQIATTGESYVSGSGTVHYRYDGGSWQTSALVSQGGDLFQANLPAADCNDTPQYYVSAEGTMSGVVTNPSGAPADFYTFEIGEYTVLFEDNFETDQGWTVENDPDLGDGPWDRGVPVNCARGDPPTDSDGSGQCYLTDNSDADACNSDIDGGYTRLLSPNIDLSGGDAEIRFDLWYTNDFGADPNNDLFYIHVSNDGGGNWTLVETIGPASPPSSWIQHTFMLSDYVTPTSQVKVRFEASDLGSGSVVEAGVDAFNVTSFSCDATPTCDDGIQNQGEDRIDCGGPCPSCECTSDAACSNGQYCDGVETCDNYGHCQAGTAVDCNDGVSCTVDSCNEGTDSCDHAPNDALCDNGQYCDGAETCDAVLDCQVGTAVDCDDSVGCTVDSCNEGTDSCDNVPNDALCNNGQYCDGAETCDPLLDCQPGTAVDCNDGVGCTVDSCNEGTDSCDNVPNDTLCDNGQYCDGAETCDPVLDCQSGTTVDCDDGVSCTVDSCNESTDSCDHAPNDALCDNGQYCDGAETCDPILDCQTGTSIDCSDGVACTVDTCNEADDTCDHVPSNAFCDNTLFCDGEEVCDVELDCQPGDNPCPGQSCDEETDACVDCFIDEDCADGLFCNGVEQCVGGSCLGGTPIDCNDGVGCTVDSCNEGTDSCDNVPDDALCDNGQYCDGAETCDPVLDCQAGTAVDCDDSVGCTVDSCNEGTDSCDNVPNDALCDNGQYCDGAETCDPVLDCQPGSTVDCNDGVSCTVDSCNEGTDSCDNVPNDTLCDNGQYCDGSETCDQVLDCQPGTMVDCDDSVACTVDSCNEGTDSCDNVPDDALCDNGQYCDGAETCDPVLDCQLGMAVDCNDGVSCTVDSCNEGTDSCDNVPNDTLCDNGEYCDGAESCDPVLDCQPGSIVDCDDGVGCTVDSCNESTDSCDSLPNDALCDNGQYCDGAETCDAELDCQSGEDPCPGQSCDEDNDACVDCFIHEDCADGLFCNGVEQCVDGACLSGTPVDCDDGVGCTADSCNEDTDSCDNVPEDASCDNGLYCDGIETCDPVNDCQPGTAVDCNDGVGCTVDSCNEETDSCDHAPDDGLCNNGQYCDGDETCDSVADCQPGTSVDCDDGVSCTLDVCNEDTDSCDFTPQDTLCDNGLFCDGAEWCDPVASCQDGVDPCDPDEICNEEEDVCELHFCATLPSPSVCKGDVNGDGDVSPVDVGLVKFWYGNTDPENLCYFDVDCDGSINPADVGLVKFYYGSCTAESELPCWMEP